MTDTDLLRRARELGVETFYWDVDGTRHESNVESIAKVVEILEADYAHSRGRVHPVIVGQPGTIHVGTDLDQVQVRLADGTTLDVPVVDQHVTLPGPLPVGSHDLSLTGCGIDEASTIVIAPTAMPRSERLQGATGLFAPAYALWERDAPLPSYQHLAALGRALPGLGADVLVTLPLYAGFLDEPFDPSPYAPVSRQHWNEVYLDDAFFDSHGASAPIPEFGELIDWRTLARRRRAQLLTVAGAEDADLTRRVSEWMATRPDVAAYARFRATERPDPTDAGRPAALVEASHHLAQYLAHDQLSRLEGDGSAALALDLPIGGHPDGFERWSHPDLFAPEISVGAPPDELFTDGQDWGLPAQLPGAAERSGFALWRTLVSSCGRYSSLVRIDHVLGLHRLWWVPRGMSARDGVYVRYPRHALTSVIAAEAEISNTTVVGENLGTVPQEIFDLLAEWSMIGLHSERLFIDPERLAKEGGLTPVPADSVACFRTHDMEPFAALYENGELGAYRDALEAFLETPIAATSDALLDASQQRLARSQAYLALADLDDLVGETTPHNVPGKVLPTIWRRRLARPTTETLAEPRVRKHLATLTQRGAS
jgi:4-alpha-glucanotransferase